MKEPNSNCRVGDSGPRLLSMNKGCENSIFAAFIEALQAMPF